MSVDLGPMDPIDSPNIIHNLDCQHLIRLIDTELVECARCVSATRHETNQHDLKRMVDWLSFFKLKYEVAKGAPELDLPKYHPRSLRADKPPTLNRVENASIQHYLNLLTAFRIEISFSDSEERTNSFSPADAGRVEGMIEKLGNWIGSIEAEPDLDVPDVDRQDPGANV